MTVLTPELRQAILESGDEPVAVVDPQTHERYVLLRAERYERLQLLWEQKPLSQEEQRSLLSLAGRRAGWDDPVMDVYNDLDPCQ
jgi:PHD/YefM family antitoxin component YafN of YafNO toxin-antitoxin module